ncbi:MAG: DNA translocase FtsK [Gemmatimonadota bacterium]|jgi:S-DNA-T family DNA segregation ATPase FtsK/SpoIIIE
MVTPEQRREIGGIALLAIALSFLLSLLPVTVFGARGLEWFPSGNMMGPAGGAIRGVLTYIFGVSAFLTPAIFTILGLHAGDWLSRERAIRFGALFGGLLVLGPVLIRVLGAEEAGGWLGEDLGGALVGLVGGLGALIITSVALVALSVGTLGWNPLRSVGRGMLAGGDVAGRTAKRLADRGRELAESRGQRSEGIVVIGEEEAEAVEGMAPEWAATDRDDADEPEDAFADVAPDDTDAADEEVATGVAALEPDPFAESVSDDEDDLPESDAASDGWGDEVPPMELLSAPEARDRASMERQLDELGQILVEKLKTFNVQSELGGRTTGPMVTQFEVVPAPGVKVNRIANLDADLALAMKAHAIRIVAPIPGKGAVGVEIPNPRPEIVNLREVLESAEFRNAKGELPLALGKDLNGRPYVASLEKMPHVLIAGATGSGKSVCLNTIVTSLVYKNTPETLRLLMIDPKMVELSVYSRLPHLRHNVVTDPKDAAGVLKWAVLEMERRYALLKANHVRSIQEFNRKARAGTVLKRSEPKGPEGDENRWIYADGVLPYIVVVVDELADLMMTVQSEVEKPLTQLAQKARAIGIHLIVATQRPSVNVITGLIKANFPTRIAFRVASKTDSRTILDQNGADALLGNGDMLFLPPGRSDPVRIQGAYLPTEDTERLMHWYVDLLERRGPPETEEEHEALETDILEELRGQEMEDAAAVVEEIAADWDELFRAAAEVCIQNQGGSTSLLQRRLSIGYGRAARIVDQLEDAGVLGPSEGAKGREVLVDMAELDAICGMGSSGS